MKKLSVLFAIALVTTSFCIAASNIDAKPTNTGNINESVDSPLGSEITIEIEQGNVTIVGWNQATTQVTGQIGNKLAEYDLKSSGNRTKFVIENADQKVENSTTDITIHVPKQVDIKFEGVNTKLEITGIEGEIEANIANGAITANQLSGEIELEVVNGPINTSNLSGELELSTVNGDISDRSSTGSEFEIQAVNGNVSIDTQIPELEIEGVNMNATIKTQQLSKLEMSSVNGQLKLDVGSLSDSSEIEVSGVNSDVELTLPDQGGFDVKVELHDNGSIDNQLTVDQISSNNRIWGDHQQLKFVSGQQQTRIDIEAVSGDVKLINKSK